MLVVWSLSREQEGQEQEYLARNGNFVSVCHHPPIRLQIFPPKMYTTPLFITYEKPEDKEGNRSGLVTLHQHLAGQKSRKTNSLFN